jgi:hypothetical protein
MGRCGNTSFERAARLGVNLGGLSLNIDRSARRRRLRRCPGFVVLNSLEPWLRVEDAIPQRSDARGLQTCLRSSSGFSLSGPFVAQFVTIDSSVSGNAFPFRLQSKAGV